MEESLNSADENIIELLKEKVRNQAQRLITADQYRLLCEKRIQELCPGHSFPVKNEDLGTPGSQKLSEELRFAKEKISRLEQEICKNSIEVPLAESYTFPHPSTELTYAQLKELYSAIYFQHYKLIRENKNLEDCLKAEIQLSEEQKAYIDVLKQSIESNSRNSSQEFKESFHKREKSESFDEKRNSVDESLKSPIEVWTDREQTDRFLKEAAEALQFAEEEVQKLEEHNEKLNEELMKSREKEEKARKDLEAFKAIERDTRSEMDKKSEIIENLGKSNNELGEKCRKAEKDLLELDKAHKDLEISYLNLEKQLKSTAESLQIKESRTNSLVSINDSLQNENNSLKSSSNSLQNELKSCQKALEVTRADFFDSKEKLFQASSKLMQLEALYETTKQKSNETQANFEKTEKNLQEKQLVLAQTKKEISGKMQVLENKIRAMQELIEEYELKLKENEGMIGKLQEKEKKLQEDIRKSKTELERNLKELSASQSENKKLREQVEKFRKFEEKVEKQVKDLEEMANQQKFANDNLRNENETLKTQCLESQSSKQDLLASLKSQESYIAQFKSDFNNFKAHRKQLISELSQESASKYQLQEENQKLTHTLSSLSLCQAQLEDSSKRSALFCSTFGALSLESASFNPLLSEQFKDFVHKNNKEFHASIPDFIEILCNEVESVIRQLANVKSEHFFLLSQLDMKKQKIKELNEMISFKEENGKNAVEELELGRLDYERLMKDKEFVQCKLQSVNQELLATRQQWKETKDELEKALGDVSSANCKIISLKRSVDNEASTRKKSEMELDRLIEEKELLNQVLITLEKTIPANELDSIYEEILNKRETSFVMNRTSLLKTQKEKDYRSFSYDFYTQKLDY